MNNKFSQYNRLSKAIGQLIKQENNEEAFQKFNEILNVALQLTDADKWYVESANRKIRFLIKLHDWDKLKKFREESNSIMNKFGDNPFHKWSISKHLNNLALMDEYEAYRLVISSIKNRLLSSGLINEEMERQERFTELKDDQKTFYSELIEKIGKYGYKIKNQSELKKLTQMNHTDLQNMNLLKILMETIIFPVQLR